MSGASLASVVLSTRGNSLGAIARTGLALAFATGFAFAARAAPTVAPAPVTTPSSSAPAPTAATSASGSASVVAKPYTIPWSNSAGDTREGLDPFPSTGQYISYGASFFSEAKLGSGRLCPADAKESCVLGGGGGLAFSGFYRGPSSSLGAIVEVTFHDSNAIYQRGVLQQLRGEWRLRPRWAVLYESVNGFASLGAGIAAYGDDWAIATFGPAGHIAVGAEIDLGVKLALVVGFAYRLMYFRQFVDATGQDRPAGLTQMLGFQLGLELHDPL